MEDILPVINSCQAVYALANIPRSSQDRPNELPDEPSDTTSEMVAGQNSVEYVQPGFRLANTVGSQSSKTTVSVPITRTESRFGVVPSEVTLPAPADKKSEGQVGLTVKSTPSKFIETGSNLTSNALRVVITSSASSEDGIDNEEVREVVAVLQNHGPQVYSNHTDATEVITNCEAGVVAVVRTTCPSGFDVVHNCTGIKTSQCPNILQVPTCEVIWTSAVATTSTEHSSTCKTAAFTPTNTTCLCRVVSVKGGRRLATGDAAMVKQKTEEVEVVAMTVFVADEFASTLAQSDSITEDGLKQSLAVFFLFGALW
jgi:hypothetical protein